MELAQQNWYSEWFDTPYYHILYKERDDEEAQLFMKNLVAFLKLEPGASILDLACGKGRHSIYLNKLGFNVTGVDLSENSITHARRFQNENLKFKVHCMCEPVDKKFDAVFNLFTSLGYFENEEDNFDAISAIKKELKEGGFGVIDFMNVHKVVENLIPSEVKSVDGIDFKITRCLKNDYILKKIEFEDEGQNHSYLEKVRAFSLNDFKNFFDEAGINLLHIFGTYDLEEYDEKKSDRLILVFN